METLGDVIQLTLWRNKSAYQVEETRSFETRLGDYFQIQDHGVKKGHLLAHCDHPSPIEVLT